MLIFRAWATCGLAKHNQAGCGLQLHNLMMNILTKEFEFEVANLYFYQKILYAITSFIYFILLVFNNTA